MIAVGTFEVWSVARLNGDEYDGLVKVVLKQVPSAGADTTFNCTLEQAPLIGSQVRVGWE